MLNLNKNLFYTHLLIKTWLSSCLTLSCLGSGPYIKCFYLDTFTASNFLPEQGSVSYSYLGKLWQTCPIWDLCNLNNAPKIRRCILSLHSMHIRQFAGYIGGARDFLEDIFENDIKYDMQKHMWRLFEHFLLAESGLNVDKKYMNECPLVKFVIKDQR